MRSEAQFVDRRRFGGLAAAGLALLPSMARAQIVAPPINPADHPPPEVEEPNGAAASRVPTGRDSSARLTAPVMINGAGPFQFMIDTGANRSVINKELAERLALPPGPAVSLNTVAKASMRPSVIIDRLQLGDRVQRRVRAPSVNLAGAPDVDGVLGVDWLRGRRLLLDFKGKSLEIGAPQREASREGRVIVPAKRRSGQLTMIDADIGGRPISALVDSGSELSLGNDALRKMVASSGSVNAGKFQRIGITSILGENFPGDLLYVPFMRLGGLTIGNAPVVFAESHAFRLWGLTKTPAVILGMDLLTQFDAVALDFGNSTVRFDFT